MNYGSNWKIAKSYGAIVSETPYDGLPTGGMGYDDPKAVESYGGYLVAESIPETLRPIISAAPDLLASLIEFYNDLLKRATFGINDEERAMLARAEAAIIKAREGQR